MKEFVTKHKKRVIWSSIIIVVLLLSLFMYLKVSATLHFSLQTELLTTHTPAQVILNVTNGVTSTVSILTNVNTFHTCDNVCDYTVNDGRDEEKTYGYNLVNKTEKQLTHTFNVTAPARGFGQQIYYFKSSCKTIESTFCPSTHTQINQTSIIIVNFNLKSSEQRFVDSIEQINSTLVAATKQVEQLRYAKQLRLVWPQPEIQAPDDKELTDKITAFTKAWVGNEFTNAQELLQQINSSLYNITNIEFLIDKITNYNKLQTDVANFLLNDTLREYIAYAQEYKSSAGTVKQAVNRLTTILSQSFIADLPRAQYVATGAMQYLQTQTENYTVEKNNAQTTVDFARTLLPLIKTSLSTLPRNQCDAVNAILSHNDWAIESNLTILDEAAVHTIVQPVNATYLFNISTDFCKPSDVVGVDISLDENIAPKIIRTPTQINLTAPKINAPSPRCFVGSQIISCDKKTPPILFIHGHSFDESNSPQISMMAFSQLQEKLEGDGYVNAGELSENANETILPPLTMRASFYYIKEYGVGDYSVAIQKSERIENYAIRLKEIIEDLKRISGSPTVTVIAHSMGGLVVREYASLFGTESLNHVITINTPHQGIVGRTVSICTLLGATKECEDMTANSTFLKRLPPVTGEWDVIASTGCYMKDGIGDGVVIAENSVLPGAKYHLINGTCTDALDSDLHTKALEDVRVYNLLISILNGTTAK